MSSSSHLSLSNVRLNKVGLACVTLFLLLIGVSSFTTVNGNEFDDSESHSGRSRLHHSRPSSSAILDAHQEVVPISLVESLAEQSHAVEVDVGNNEITVEGDEEDPDLLSVIAEENEAIAIIRAKYEQLYSPKIAVSKMNLALEPKVAIQKKYVEKSISKKIEKNSNSNMAPRSKQIRKLAQFLELEAEVKSESKSKSMVAVGAYPAFGLFGSTVTLLRNAIQADPPGLVLNGFTYVFDPAAAGSQVGRIRRVHGPVAPVVGPRAVQARSVEWCDVQYNPVPPFIAGVASRTNALGGGRRIQQSGHIIGYAIGGDSREPINFYPQHRSSNNQGGRWGKTEAIALHVAAVCNAREVSVDIRFTAWSANGVYPIAGKYRVEVANVCVNALNAAGGGVGCPGGGAVANVGNAYVRTFCRWARPKAGVWRYTSHFSNNAADNIAGLPALGLPNQQYFP